MCSDEKHLRMYFEKERFRVALRSMKTRKVIAQLNLLNDA